MIWMIQAMWDYIVGLFPVLPILMQNIELLHFQIWWKKPLTGAFGIWQCRIISSGAKEKYSLMDFSKLRFCWRKYWWAYFLELTPVLKMSWCRKYCLLLPSWYLLPPILLSCYYMLCLFDRCNYLDFHTLVYSDNISVFLYIYSEGVWLFASQDIRLQCEIV